MSDLTATHCGREHHCDNGFGGGSLIWIILLLSICGGGSGGFGGFGGLGRSGGGENGSCDILLLVLILSCCGNSFC